MKNEWLASHGVPTVTRKLDFGDYAYGPSNIVVDTKQDLQEVAGNVGREHERFVRELERARSAGYRLVVLVECGDCYNDRAVLSRWVSRVCRSCRKCNPLIDRCAARRFKPMNGPTLSKIVRRLELDHGARFMFCDKKDAARVICDLLGVPYEL